MIISKYWSSHRDYRSNWPPSPAEQHTLLHPGLFSLHFNYFLRIVSSPVLSCPPSPPALRQDCKVETMNGVCVCHGMPCWCYGQRCEVSGSAFISSMKILVIVFVLPHSSPSQATTWQARLAGGNRNINLP